MRGADWTAEERVSVPVIQPKMLGGSGFGRLLPLCSSNLYQYQAIHSAWCFNAAAGVC